MGFDYYHSGGSSGAVFALEMMRYHMRCRYSLLSKAASIAVLTLALTGGHAPAHSQASTTAKSINKAAQDCVGKEMWKKGYGLKSGGLGCAASVSNVLNKAGIAYVRTPVTLYMRRQILQGKLKVKEFVIKNGEKGGIDDTRLNEIARRGDVLVAFMNPLPGGNIGPKAHCGIIGAPGHVFTNDWNDGIWKHGNIHDYFDSYRYIRVLRFL